MMRSRTSPGWSLLEVALVLAVLAILLTLAIPAYSLFLKRSRLTALANDLRIHENALNQYALQEGDYPPSHAVHGSFIPGLDSVLSARWKEPSPVGGSYEWVYTRQPDPADRAAFIQIVQTPTHPFGIRLADVVQFDADFDDGNLASGHIQIAGARIRYFTRLPQP